MDGSQTSPAPPHFEVLDLWDKIKHGDDAHRLWLLEALRAYRDGRPVPPVVSKPNS